MGDVAASLLKTLSTPLLQEAVFLYGIGEQVDRLKDVDMIEDGDKGPKNLVQEIGDLAYEAEDIIETFVLQGMQQNRRGFMSSLTNCARLILQLRGRHEVGTRIEAISNRLGHIARVRPVYDPSQSSNLGEATSSGAQRFREMRKTSPLEVERDLVGIEEKANFLKGSLLDGVKQRCVVSVVGMGGVGKTTLIKKVYNADDIKVHFNYFDWVCVSQTYDLIEIFRGMIKKVLVSHEGLQNMGEQMSKEVQNMSEQKLKEVLHTHLSTMRYLVVLDDVWDIHACRIVITTRKEDLAMMVERNTIHGLTPLSNKESWELFCIRAFVKNHEYCPEYLMSISHGIVERCGGLPLALVVIGALLSRKLVFEDTRTTSEWQKVLDVFSHYQDRGEVEISKILSSSFFDLPYYLKPCFLYLSAYPEDFKIKGTKLIQLWDYLEELISRSMILVERVSSSGRIRSCAMHDLLREVCLSIAGEQNFLGVVADKDNMPSQRARRLVFHKSIDDHVSSYKSPSKVRSFLFFPHTLHTCISKHCLFNVKLVRVLLLENLTLKCAPKEIGKSFVFLEVPKSIRKLRHLDVLDLRAEHIYYRRTWIRSTSSWSLELPSLRHFYEAFEIPPNVEGCNARVREPFGNFPHLKKLGIKDMEDKDIRAIYNCIGQLKCLRSLSLRANPPLALEKLELYGELGKLPSWFGNEELPSCLALWFHAYMGKEMHCIVEGFPRLQRLVLIGLYQLEKWKGLEEGSMPDLHTLNIQHCPSLKMLPEGLKHISTLQQVICNDAPHLWRKTLSTDTYQECKRAAL
ncbi:hypothetical protein AMTRI_Chr03g144400 [Amborella trichopoda]